MSPHLQIEHRLRKTVMLAVAIVSLAPYPLLRLQTQQHGVHGGADLMLLLRHRQGGMLPSDICGAGLGFDVAHDVEQ